MHSTHDFEHILDDPGIQAVEYDADADEVIVFVTEKLDEDDLESERLIRERIPNHATNVVEIGDLTALPAYEPDVSSEGAAGHRDPQDTPIGGASEIQAGSTAATAGLLAEVTAHQPGPADWQSDVQAGDRVRVSNAHVYGDSRNEFGHDILQPSPLDGGSDTDAVGTLTGCCPLDDPVVDAAARDCTADADEASGLLGLGDVDGVRRDRYEELKGASVVKAGRTTGITEGEIVATSATVNVGYGAETHRKRNQVLTTDMSAGGDSGSPVLLGTRDDPGALVGHLFAGSSNVTVVNRAADIEDRLGVEFTVGDQDHASERSFEDYVEEQLVAEYGEASVERQHRFANGRYADFLVFDDDQNRLQAWELENDSGSLVNGLGQSLFYAQSALEEFPEYDGCIPVLCFPEGHVDDDERPLLERAGAVLTEYSVPDDVSLEGV